MSTIFFLSSSTDFEINIFSLSSILFQFASPKIDLKGILLYNFVKKTLAFYKKGNIPIFYTTMNYAD